MNSNDILIEPDLQIKEGDIFVSVADDYNSEYIVYSQKGQLRKNQLLGVGILDFINAPVSRGRDIVKAIKEEHKRDGYKVKDLDVSADKDGKTELSLTPIRIRK